MNIKFFIGEQINEMLTVGPQTRVEWLFAIPIRLGLEMSAVVYLNFSLFRVLSPHSWRTSRSFLSSTRRRRAFTMNGGGCCREWRSTEKREEKLLCHVISRPAAASRRPHHNMCGRPPRPSSEILSLSMVSTYFLSKSPTMYIQNFLAYD